MHRRLALLAAASCLAPLILSACSDNDDSDRGRLNLSVTDAPVDDAARVVVEFTGVEVKPAGSAPLAFTFDAPRQIDLLALTGVENERLLDGVDVPAGNYEWIRLAVNTSRTELDSFIELEDGSQHPLFVPSGAESGLKLNGVVVVPEGGVGSFTVDFDLRRSVHEPQNAGEAYFLRPTLRLVSDFQVGAIRGTIDPTLVPEGCSPAVYVFNGSGTTPDDVGSAGGPVNSAIVELDGTAGTWGYVVGFLPQGPYTVAYTCDSGNDDPETDDTLVFAPAKDATVSIGATTTVDFP